MTPIRCGADAWAHQDVRRGDMVAWPTNLGWMMGPWLLYAALLNGACIALYQVRRTAGLSSCQACGKFSTCAWALVQRRSLLTSARDDCDHDTFF